MQHRTPTRKKPNNPLFGWERRGLGEITPVLSDYNPMSNEERLLEGLSKTPPRILPKDEVIDLLQKTDHQVSLLSQNIQAIRDQKPSAPAKGHLRYPFRPSFPYIKKG